MSKTKASIGFFCLLSAVLIGGQFGGNAFAIARHSQQSPQLVVGQRVEREWENDQPHLYPLHLEAGQYVSLRLDVLAGKFFFSVTLITPHGKRIEGTQENNEVEGQASPALLAIVYLSGDYTVEVRSGNSERSGRNNSSLPSRYAITLTGLGAPTEEDKIRVEAWHSFIEAQQNHGLDTEASLVKAKKLFLKTVTLFHQIGEAQFEQEALLLLADVYNSLGEYEEAAEVSRQGAALAHVLSNGGESAALMSGGEAYIHLGDYPRAIEVFQQALPLWQAQGNRSTDGVGWTLHSLATCYYLLGERRKAIEFGEAAFNAYQSVDFNAQELYRGSGATATNLGRTYLSLGELQEATKWLDIGLAYWKKAKEMWGEARVYYYLGDYYSSLGDLQLARENYDLALSKWRISNDPNDIGNVLQSLGGLALKSRDYVSAPRYLSEALDIRIKHKQRRGQAETLALLGRYYAATSEPQKAIEHYSQSLALCREIGARAGEAIVLSNLGETYFKLGDKHQAREMLQQALQLHRAVQSPDGEAQTLYWLARAERDLGLLAEARHSIEAAVTASESIRASVVSQDLRASYLASVRDYYELYIDLLMQKRDRQSEREALHFNEAASARSLLESLRESHVDLQEGVDPALLARERELKQLLNGKSEYQARLFSGPHKPEQASAIASEINAVVGQLRETHARIRAVSPRYAALTQPEPLTVEQIQRELLDDDTLLLEYALGEERSYVWAVTPTTLTSYELPKRAEIEEQVRRVYELLTARNKPVKGETPRQELQRIARADADLPAQAAALSKMILVPVAAQLGKKRLLIVAQGKLQFIPFAALPEPESAQAREQSAVPLVANHEIVHLPSASTLAVLRQQTAGRKPALKKLALLADPVYELNDDRFTKLQPEAKSNVAPTMSASYSRDLLRAAEVFGDTDELLQFHRLRGTEREAERIARLIPAAQMLKATGFAANREMAMSGVLGNYQIVHFASHGFLHSEHPDLSGIVLSLVDKRGEKTDGFLRLHNIYNLKLSANLVVLSACRTGLGKEVKGEGLMSLARGFMYAGAPRVIVSAWSVQDDASATLMIKFYNHLFSPKKLSAAAALRAAQLEMWRDKQLTSPYFWAGFELQGEWR